MGAVFWGELIASARQLARARSFTVPAVLGLAIAIGATTAVFGVFHTMLLRPMGFRDTQSLVTLWQTDVRRGQKHVEVCYADLLEWRKRARLLTGVALVSSVNLDFPLTGDGQPQQVEGTIVTGNFFDLLGATPLAGRFLTPSDDQPNSPTRVVISHRLWRTRFGGDYSIVGRQLRSGNDSLTVIGIARPEFDFPRDVDIWAPLRVAWPTVEQDSRLRVFRAVGRLKPGTSIEQARAEMSVIAANILDTLSAGNDSYAVLMTPIVEEIFGAARTAVWLLLGAVFLVLLIACGNVSNLLLARGTVRGREVAIRTALGAGRGRLVRLLLADALVLAVAGGLIGLLLARMAVAAIVRLAPPDVPRMDQIAVDNPVLAFGILLSFLTVLVFGLAPALMSSNRDPNDVLKQSSGRASASRSHTRMRAALVVAQVGVCTVLLVGAGLLLRSFRQLAALDPGFNPKQVLTFRVTLSKPDQESRRAFYGQVLERIRALPGVHSAAAVLIRPLSGLVGWDSAYMVEGQSQLDQATNPNANYEAVSPEYFRTMGIRLIAGRDFTSADTNTAPGVVIVNESTARRHWSGRSAIGQRIRLGKDAKDPWLTVVGVANDVRYREWEAVRADMYVPYLQRAQHRTDFVIKTHGDPEQLVSLVRREILALDKDQLISNVTTMEALVDRALARSRFNGVVLSILSASALGLAAIGLYGVLFYGVAQRTNEIGVRIAIGASRWHVLRLIAAGGLRLVMLGLVFGIAAATALSRLAKELLFGVAPLDPLTYAGACLLLLTVATVACLAPALHATAIDPVNALRSE